MINLLTPAAIQPCRRFRSKQSRRIHSRVSVKPSVLQCQNSNIRTPAASANYKGKRQNQYGKPELQSPGKDNVHIKPCGQCPRHIPYVSLYFRTMGLLKKSTTLGCRPWMQSKSSLQELRTFIFALSSSKEKTKLSRYSIDTTVSCGSKKMLPWSSRTLPVQKKE